MSKPAVQQKTTDDDVIVHHITERFTYILTVVLWISNQVAYASLILLTTFGLHLFSLFFQRFFQARFLISLSQKVF